MTTSTPATESRRWAANRTRRWRGSGPLIGLLLLACSAPVATPTPVVIVVTATPGMTVTVPATATVAGGAVTVPTLVPPPTMIAAPPGATATPRPSDFNAPLPTAGRESPTAGPPPTTVAPISPTPLAPRPPTIDPPSRPLPPGDWVSYEAAGGEWSLRYPRDLLKVEGPAAPLETLTIFISADRATVIAVDVFDAPPGFRGNTGEGFRNRAREMLDRVYGRPVNLSGIIEQPPAGWATGITFTTALGSTGEAVYQQRGPTTGTSRVYGVLYGYKVAAADQMAPVVQAARASFRIG